MNAAAKILRFPRPLTVADHVPVRGYHAVYRHNETNRCPGCGRTNWLVGRVSAECAFCGTALMFAGAQP